MDMKHLKSPVLTMTGSAFMTFLEILPSLLLFEIVYKLLCSLIFRPILSGITQGALTLSGHEMVFNGDIAGFFMNIPGILGTILLGMIAAFLAYFEYAVIILMIYYRYTDASASLADSMKMALTTFKSLKSFGFIGFVLYSLGLLPLLGLGFAPSIHPDGEIPNFITGELYKSLPGSILMVFFYIIMYLLFFCAIFVLPIMVLRRRKFGRSFRFSLSILLSARLRNIIPLLLVILLWCVLLLYPGVIPTYYAGISDASLAEILGNFFFSWKSILHFLLGEGLQICLTLLIFTFLVATYILCSGKVSLNEQAVPSIEQKLQKTHGILSCIYSFFKRISLFLAGKIQGLSVYQKHKKSIWAVTFALLFLIVFGILYSQPNSYDRIVIGHRGSQHGAENTLQAIKGAVDANADYAEVDILLSKDGIPMVIHDDNLKRLTGENVNIYDLTAAQLSKLTVKQNKKTGRISTLDQVIDYSRGKIDLLIELKLHGHEKTNIVKAVTRVVEENHFQKNCEIMSLEYDLVKILKTHYPEYTAGYCVFGNLGAARLNALRELNVDFLVIEESMASNNFIAQCSKAWLPVYIWTVNTSQSMESCLKMGAAGIITDHPKEARTAVDAFSNQK